MWRRSGLCAALLLLVTGGAWAGGPFGIDHEIALDQSGIWARKYQTGLEIGVIALEVGAAAWFGKDDPLGHTFWQTIDSTAISAVAALALKKATGRARPNQGNDPNKWFRGGCCESFPSGEVTLQASFVTPFIVDYSKDHPWVWALELLPLYDSIARLKSHAHWQSDVIAGWALGTAAGYWSAKRATPIMVQILPDGITIGLSKRF
jgi:undecaprenyl-diphosphatase